MAALRFCLECKLGFKGALFRWMFTLGLWNLGSPTVGGISEHKLCLNGVAAGFSCTFSSATCTNQIRKHLKGRKKPEYLSFSRPPKTH